jgi:hypothetical protein
MFMVLRNGRSAAQRSGLAFESPSGCRSTWRTQKYLGGAEAPARALDARVPRSQKPAAAERARKQQPEQARTGGVGGQEFTPIR